MRNKKKVQIYYPDQFLRKYPTEFSSQHVRWNLRENRCGYLNRILPVLRTLRKQDASYLYDFSNQRMYVKIEIESDLVEF